MGQTPERHPAIITAILAGLVIIFSLTTFLPESTEEKACKIATCVTPDFSEAKKGFSRALAVFKTSKGSFQFRFNHKHAPISTKRVAELIQEGFYDKLPLFSVRPGFLVQTGDPIGDGTGGSNRKLRAEFKRGTIFSRGSVGMARAPKDPNSADSQFFISLKAQPHLNYSYTHIGYVTKGIETLEKLVNGDLIESATIFNRDFEEDEVIERVSAQ